MSRVTPFLVVGTLLGAPWAIAARAAEPVILCSDTVWSGRVTVAADKLVHPLVEDNAITGNSVGVYRNFSAYPPIHGNDLPGSASFALVLGDNQSVQVKKQIRVRDRGLFHAEVPKEPPVPALRPRKFAALRNTGEGLVDARGNGWGADATAQMKAVGEAGNVAVIEDSHDKPDAEHLGKKFPRDTVAFAPWAEARPAEVGRTEPKYSGLRGKVIFEGKPVSGVRVHVYQNADGGFAGEGFAYSAPTGADGTFSLNLRSGRYFVVGKRAEPPFPDKEPGVGELYGYYGGNPVTVPEGSWGEANVQVVRRKPLRVETGTGESGVLHGVVLGPAGPEEGASVCVYPDARADFRGPDLTSPQGSVAGGTGPDGSFSVELPPGTYYVVAARRQGGAQLGPLRPGDRFGYFDGNPVKLEPGRRVEITLQILEKLKDSAAGKPGGAGTAAIRGVLRDVSGKPRSGLFAFASETPQFAGGMPPFRSPPVGPDGVYVIEVPRAGTYYVGARSGYGGPPLPGQWQGVYGDSEPRPVVVEEGKVTENVDVTVRPIE